MRNTRKSHPANGLQMIWSIKPCKVRIKRIVWHPKPLQNIGEIIQKKSRRKSLAVNENTTVLNVKKPLTHKSVHPQEKSKRKSLLNISNTYTNALIDNNKGCINQSVRLMLTEQSVEVTATKTTGVSSTVKGKKVKTLSQQKQKAGHKKQTNNLLTKTNPKRNAKAKLIDTATNEVSYKLPKSTSGKFLFTNKKLKKLCEDKLNADGEQNITSLPSNSIYEFHSQSTTYMGSTKREDPTADIVSKLIKQGKVRVATCAKGKGKPIIKRATHKQNTQQKKVRFDNGTKAQTINAKSSAKIKTDKNHNICGHLVDDLNKSSKKALNTLLLSSYQQFENNTSFSPLAQLVLRRQANKFNNTTEPAPQTVQHTKSISTPIREGTNPPINLSYALSPIRTYSHAKQQQHRQQQQQKQISYLSSPWRVNRESMNLPTVFHFNLTSDCSPSFSSDFIHPQISRGNLGDGEESSTSSSVASAKLPITAAEKALEISANAVQDDGTEQNSLAAEIIENLENLPPPASLETLNSSLEILSSPKAAIKSFMDLNPLKNTKQHRLPLKSLNILNVVELPPWKPLPITKGTTVNNEKISNCDSPNNNIQCESILRREDCQPLMNVHRNSDKERIQGRQFPDVVTNIEEHEEYSFGNKSSSRLQEFENSWQHSEDEEVDLSENDENIMLFGFEEYFPSIEQQANKEIVLNFLNNDYDKRSLHEKLSDLKKFRPRLHPPSSSSTATITNFPRRNLFDSNLKQRKINELFYNQNIRNINKSKAEESFMEANCTAELFSNEHEIEPEVVNKKEIKRNYVKGWRHRPRLIEKQYTICLDSDESDEEWNTNMKPTPKKRGPQKPKKENAELTRYVKSFNEMCNDVEKYNLIIEKDTLI